MTTDRDVERLLDRWLAEGPRQVSDRVLDETADRLRRQRQRPAWRAGLGEIDMTLPIRIAAAAAAVLVVGFVGFGLLGSPSGPGGGPLPSQTLTPTPTAPASPSPSAGSTPQACQTSDPGCTGPLAPGRHATANILMPFTYEVPDGWSKPLDEPGAVNLQATASGYDAFIGAWPDWAIASQTTCTAAPEPGLGRTVDDLVTFLVEHPGLVASEPRPVTIGGLDGQVLDIHKHPDWTGPCGGRVSLFTHRSTINDIGWWDIDGSDRLRLYFLDAGNGRVVNVDIQTAEAGDFEAFLEIATPVVESFDFTP